MTEPILPDGHRPAVPPRVGEQPADSSDDTPERPRRPIPPPADPTTVAVGSPPPPGPTPPPSGATPPPYGATPPPFAATPPPSGATPQYGTTPPPPYAAVPSPMGGPPPGPGGPVTPTGPKKRSPLLIAGLAALAIALVGGLAFAATQIGGDDPEAEPRRTDEEEDDEDEPVDTIVTTVATTIDTSADGSVRDLLVRIEALGAVVPDADIQTTLQRIGQKDENNPVSTTDDVASLCAAILVETPVNARVDWKRDNSPVFQSVSRRMEPPADGNCINNNGQPIEPGSYEVSFIDDAGDSTTVALFTVGATTRSQGFVNDTGQPLCTIEVSPTTAGFYHGFVPQSGELADGEVLVIDIADVEHEARGVDCNGEQLDSIFFTPSDGDIGLTDGTVIGSGPETTAPPAEITDLELLDLVGVIDSLDVPVANDDEAAAVIGVLIGAGTDARVATTEPSLALCVGWSVPGPLAADIVWEFNRVEVARFPVQAVDGQIGNCVPPEGASFQEGAYQAYLQRGDFISSVQTFTVGRAQTQLAFVNDTGVEICEVGFSPNLTNFYTFYGFGDADDFGAPLAVGEGFTIVAPLIENDIKARDCAGNDVAEAFDIAPTDQTLNLTTGRP